MKTKKWTGERLETHILNDNTIEHLHRYALTFQFIKNKNVLDIACGEGYGSNLMASVAKNVTGVDIDAKAVADAKLKYKKENLTFLEGRADQIPLPDHTVDVVVSFETIEHHDRHQEMMSEIKRVLKKDGVMILSSPDKKNYSDLTGFNNPHHVKELYQHEFESLVKSHFEFTLFLNQRFVVGSFIEAKTENATTVYEGSYNEIRNKGFIAPLYIVSIASDALIEKIGSSIFSSDEFINSIIRKVQNSPSFRLGNFLLRPFKIFKK